MNAQIIINADDYGISPGVSSGIRTLLDAGRISATSCMTGSEFWAEDGKKLRALENSAFSAGLHITLTDQSSCEITPTLAPEGTLPSLGQLWRGILSGRIQRDDLKVEINAQIIRFADVYGELPGHIDGHHHVQQLPVVRSLVIDLWTSGVIPQQAWLRVSGDRLGRIWRRGTDPAKAFAIAAAGSGLRSRALKHGILVNDGFAGIYDLQPGSDFPDLCRRALQIPSPYLIFMCHPGQADAALAQKDSVTDQRDAELSYLMSPAFTDLLEEFPGKLVHRFDTA